MYIYKIRILCFDNDVLPYESDGDTPKYSKLADAMEEMSICANIEVDELNMNAEMFERYSILKNTGTMTVVKTTAEGTSLVTLYYIVEEEN